MKKSRRRESRRADTGPFIAPGALGYTSIGTRAAENLSTVMACVGAISSTMASLPALVYRQEAAGRIEMPDHPVARLIRRPNPHQTWPDLVEWTMAQVLLHGNALHVIAYDGAGRPTSLQPIPWGNVQISLLPSGQLAYDVVQFVAPWGGTGQPRRYLDSEVFHLRDRSDDGLIGRSRLSRAPEVLGQAMGIQTFASAVWANSATPAGALSVPAKLSQEAADRMADSWTKTYGGPGNARRVAVLEQGVEWKPFSISPEDAEVLASRRFTVEELCRLFQVPPPIVQDYTHNTFTNAAQASTWFGQITLSPWARKIEAEFSRSIFVDPRDHLQVDLSGLMRGDYQARWAAYAIAIDKNVLSANEVREAEGYDPRPENGAGA